MAMRGGMYNANKRKKELARKKKQDEKRQKRLKAKDPSEDIENIVVNAEEATDNPTATPEEISEDQAAVTDS